MELVIGILVIITIGIILTMLISNGLLYIALINDTFNEMLLCGIGILIVAILIVGAISFINDSERLSNLYGFLYLFILLIPGCMCVKTHQPGAMLDMKKNNDGTSLVFSAFPFRPFEVLKCKDGYIVDMEGKMSDEGSKDTRRLIVAKQFDNKITVYEPNKRNLEIVTLIEDADSIIVYYESPIKKKVTKIRVLKGDNTYTIDTYGRHVSKSILLN